MTTESIPVGHQNAHMPEAAAVSVPRVPARFAGLSIKRILPYTAVFAVMVFLSIVASASAVDINWSPMLDLLDSVGGTVLPELFEFFLSIAPYIVAFAVVMMILRFIGAIIMFVEKLFSIF